MKLQQELLELSREVEDFFKIKTISSICPVIEMSESVDIELPYEFKCEALHPGTFKGFTITEEEIVKAQNTIFESYDLFANNEINKDHKNNRKEESSVDDLVGKITDSRYDYSKKALVLTGQVYDKNTALKIHHGLQKYVSLRIIPSDVEYTNTIKFAKGLKFEELSFVRAPGDPNARIIKEE